LIGLLLLYLTVFSIRDLFYPINFLACKQITVDDYLHDKLQDDIFTIVTDFLNFLIANIIMFLFWYFSKDKVMRNVSNFTLNTSLAPTVSESHTIKYVSGGRPHSLNRTNEDGEVVYQEYRDREADLMQDLKIRNTSAVRKEERISHQF